MEKAKDGSKNMNNNNKNRIQVSNMKRPLFFYVNLAKRQMQQRDEVELTGLGLAVAKVVTIVEILKSSGFATEKKIMTSAVDMEQGMGARSIQKAKIEIVIQKSDKFDELIAATNEEETIPLKNT